MDDKDNVIHLVEFTASLCDPEGLLRWAQSWLEGIAKGDYGEPKSLVIVMENTSGEIGMVSQSTVHLDRAKVVGLLTILTHKKAAGEGSLLDMRLDQRGSP